MTNGESPGIRSLRRYCGDPVPDPTVEVPATAPEPGTVSDARVRRVVADLEPIRSHAGLLSSYSREAARSEVVQTAYAIRWLELARSVPASIVSRQRRARVTSPVLRSR
jgi:hypothetical protein